MGKLIGKTILITGATDGIGKQTALMLAKENIVIIHGKDPLKCKNTAGEIRKISGKNEVYGIARDLSILSEVRELAFNLKNEFPAPDILVNNAGIFNSKKEITEDGFEKTFVVNYLSHFYLTLLLLNNYGLKYPHSIMSVSSMAHSSISDKNFFKYIDFKDYYEGHDAYAASKFCQILFTYKLADKLKDAGILVNCLHPGVINTKLLRAGWPSVGTAFSFAVSAVSKIFSSEDNSSPKKGALNVINALELSENEKLTGKYFFSGKEVKSNSLSHDKNLQDELWKLSVHMTGTDLKPFNTESIRTAKD
ncbi:MAG: SDR family NAD(P)-dependent oxidoreductase [Deltaproteobacteria bacterium]|nr:SDR family NAD(P)-dependent oxidoreductase [Deltaproteobacteria bacterium]